MPCEEYLNYGEYSHSLSRFFYVGYIFPAPVVQKLDSAFHRITQLVSLLLIRWIAIYPVGSTVQRLNNRGLINHYPADKYSETQSPYPLDKDLGWRYALFEQLRPGL